MQTINAVIVEDMPIAEAHLRKLLSDNFSEINVIASYSSAKEAIKHLSGLNFQLLFLDIEFNDNYNAFRMLEDIDFTEMHIIFTTAFERYRKEADDVDSIKYLLKPIKLEELKKAVVRSMQILIGKEKLAAIEEKYEAVKTGKLSINTEGISYFIEPSDITYMEASGAYTKIFYYSGQTLNQILATQNLGKYETILSSPNFIRVHKKYLININYAKSCKRNKLKLVFGNTEVDIMISKDRRKEIIEKISLNSLDF
jgi:two-component system LytT family response regulator